MREKIPQQEHKRDKRPRHPIPLPDMQLQEQKQLAQREPQRIEQITHKKELHQLGLRPIHHQPHQQAPTKAKVLNKP